MTSCVSELVRLAVEAAPPATPEQKALIRDLMPPVPADAEDRSPRCCADGCKCLAATEAGR